MHPLTLTGLGERRHLAGPGTDLETHIEDVVQLIDHLDAPELVLVGHDYAIHPVLGAADRRPERISRVVHLPCRRTATPPSPSSRTRKSQTNFFPA
ncbi:hypothetical protein [Streptomyces sp. NBC_01643]|uniref:alpha/beta fold hydrolase n=1 Tax=Streptomyces sp. NBC_01643 TaxID=2975906 RepID=UPI002F90E13A|nr:alpha/beta hydrolase [Streptomyces sp. NBC_01643]